MNGIGQHELEEALSARAESLVPGSAPADAVLAGARRRGARRKAAAATAGVLVVAGVGVELAGFGGSRPVSTGSELPRRVPVVTQQVGLAPGQRPMSGEQVIASGTVDGAPWQVGTTEKVDPPKNDPMFAKALLNQKAAAGVPMTCVHLALRIAGGLALEESGCSSETSPTIGKTFPSIALAGTADDATYVAIVPEDVTQAVWHGLDGFEQVVVPLPTPWRGVELAVFPDHVPLRPTDDLIGFDRADTMIYQYWGTIMAPPARRG